MEKIKVDS